MPARDNTERLVTGIAAHAGRQLRDERQRRTLTLAEVADRAGVSKALVHWAEAGHAASLRTYAALATALGLRLDLSLTDPRRRAASVMAEDPVHAAMGELLAARLTAAGLEVAVDEPYQHYQFAGRADLLAWRVEPAAMLHVENRTRFPNLQEAYGAYNAKRRYLPGVLAERLGVRGFSSVTHVMVCLWSSEVLVALRRHAASFLAVCPDPAAAFEAWLAGTPPPPGVSSSLVVLDPAASPRQRWYAGLDDIGSARPRYRGYADAVQALRDRGR